MTERPGRAGAMAAHCSRATLPCPDIAAVHQFHPRLTYGDAIGNHIQDLQRLLRRIGYRSEVFCEQPTAMSMGRQGRARHLSQYQPSPSGQNLLLLHFSRGYSPEITAWLRRVPDRKVLVYHNITPERYFAGVNPLYMEAARLGREQLGDLLGICHAAWGVSNFNAQELLQRGAMRVGVLPIVFDPRRYAMRPDRRVLRACRHGFNLLTVGRLAPNKRFEHSIAAFYYLKRYLRPDARLLLVGSAQGMEPYLRYLQALVDRLDLADVTFPGHVSTAQLVAYYRCADVYLSLSEHEGFGVPLLEGMHFGVPVVAYAAGAVGETLGRRGALVHSLDLPALAELIALLGEDIDLRRQVVQRQYGRPEDFSPQVVERRLRQLLGELDA